MTVADQVADAIIRRTSAEYFEKENLGPAIQDFVDRGLAVGGFLQQLQQLGAASSQAFWEFIVGCHLARLGLDPTRRSSGPDFYVEVAGKPLWVECVAPTGANIPREWMQRPVGSAYSVPHDAIKSRWTSALYDKKRQRDNWVDRGVIPATDAFVVAICGRLLGGVWAEGDGVSQFPFGAEIAYPIGPIAVAIDVETGIGAVRPTIRRKFETPGGTTVPLDPFLRDDWSGISGILGTAAINPSQIPSAVHWVPNVRSAISLPDNWFQAGLFLEVRETDDAVDVTLRRVQ